MKKKIDLEKIIVPLLFIITSLIFVIISLVKIISTKDITSINTETTILLLLALVYVFYKIFSEKNIGSVFKININKENDKNKRIKSYLKESIIFSIVITLLDVISILFLHEESIFLNFKGLSNTLNIILNILISLIVAFIVSFVLEYLIGEKGMNNKK